MRSEGRVKARAEWLNLWILVFWASLLARFRTARNQKTEIFSKLEIWKFLPRPRKTDRELVRDRHKLEAEEQRIINEIRKNAASGNKKAVDILPRQLVKVQNQKAQSFQASEQIQSLATQNTIVASIVHMVDAMQVGPISPFEEERKTNIGRIENIENDGENEQSGESDSSLQSHPTVHSRAHENGYQEWNEYVSDYDSPCQRRRSSIAVGEAVDAAFGEEGDSEEEDVIVNQMLDEIGISLNETVLSSVSLSLFTSHDACLDWHCSSSAGWDIRHDL